MSYLTHRAERAVIAALLADPDPPLHFYGLTSEAFSSRLHRELFTTLADLATTHPGLDAADRDQLIAARLDLPGADPAALADWRQDAPDFQATASYAELVRAGAVYREVASYADVLAHKITTGIEDDDPDLAAHNLKLAEALARHADAFVNITADTSLDTGYPINIAVHVDPARSARARLEDQVLADLLRDPEQIDTVREFLTDNAFTPGSTPDESVYPITDTDTEPAAVYLARLAATTLTIESAVHAGRDLLAAHLRDTVPNPTAVAEAIIAQRAQAGQVARPATRQGGLRTEPLRQVRVDAARPAYTSARPPGPLPATGPTPQPGTTPDPTISNQPGVRP